MSWGRMGGAEISLSDGAHRRKKLVFETNKHIRMKEFVSSYAYLKPIKEEMG